MTEAHLIYEMEFGVVNNPRLFASEDLAGAAYEKWLTEKTTFRKRAQGEKWEDYEKAKFIYFDSRHTRYQVDDKDIEWARSIHIETALPGPNQ